MGQRDGHVKYPLSGQGSSIAWEWGERLERGGWKYCHGVSDEGKDKALYSGVKSKPPPSLKPGETGGQPVLSTTTAKPRKHLGLSNDLKTSIQ